MTLLELLQLLHRRLKLVICITLLATVAGGAYAIVRPSAPESVSATATVYVQPRVVVNDDGEVVSSSTTDNKLLSSSVASYITSDEVEQAVAHKLGKDSLSDFQVEAVPDEESARLINITASADDADDAVAAANAFAEAAQGASETVFDVSAVDTTNAAEEADSVVTESRAKTVVKYLAVGLVAGLLIAIAVVVIADAFDSSVRDEGEIGETVDTPVFARLPLEKDAASTAAVADEVSTLHANIHFSALKSPIKIAVIASASPADGKTYVATRLAKSIAASGKKTLLVDADFRDQGATKVAGVSSAATGLAHVVMGTASVDDAVVHTDSFDLLPAEAGVATPVDLLGSDGMATLIKDLAARYDCVIFDTPALGDHVDAAMVAEKADATILVVREHGTDRKELAQSCDQLVRAGAHILGAVLNGVDK